MKQIFLKWYDQNWYNFRYCHKGISNIYAILDIYIYQLKAYLPISFCKAYAIQKLWRGPRWILITKESWEFYSKFLIVQIKTLRCKDIMSFLSLGPLTSSPAAYYMMVLSLVFLIHWTLDKQKVRQAKTLLVNKISVC